MSEYDALLRESDEIEDGVTAGPWEHDGDTDCNIIGHSYLRRGRHIDTMRHADAAFIARSRTLIPELAAALRASEARAERLEEREIVIREATQSDFARLLSEYEAQVAALTERAEAAEKRERAYREALKECDGVPVCEAAPDCWNPVTTSLGDAAALCAEYVHAER
jgi:hypothetical protein